MAVTKTHLKLRNVWRAMKSRCFRTKDQAFERYGGRGITISDEWLDFDNFYEDMSKDYKEGLTLDRIDNDKGYSKENCRWSTPKEQSLNKRNNHRFFFEGLNLTFSEWADILGVNRSRLTQRYFTYKWPIERVLTERIT